MLNNFFEKDFITTICIIIDLFTGLFILLLPALFAELVYPNLSPHGILLAITLFGWWHTGRAISLLFVPQQLRLIVTSWLWLATLPFHVASLFLYAQTHWISCTWHGVHFVIILALALRLQSRRGLEIT